MGVSKGEVLPNLSGKTPFIVVISTQGQKVGEFEVNTVEEGEALIIKVLTDLRELAERDGHV